MELKIKELLIGQGYLVVILLASLYTIIWSLISIRSFLSFNMYVYDLGVVAERSWQVYHTSWTFILLLKEILYSGIVIIVSPLILADGYKFILVFQSFFLGFTLLPLYFIARHFMRSNLPSLLISSSYLIYFPLAGVNWYDFHYQALFIPFFITGYALYIRGNHKSAMLFLFLSGITRYPYVIFPLLLSLFIFLDPLLKDQSIGGLISRKSLYYLVFASLLIIQLILSYLLFSSNPGLTSDIHLDTTRGLFGNFYADFDGKLLTIILYLFPLLGMSLLSKKWTIFLIPAFALIMLTNNPVYLYPITFLKQYGAGIIPFLFLGLIEGTASITDSEVRGHDEISEKKIYRSRVKIAATVLIVVALVGTVYLPYGPYNSHTMVDFEMRQNSHPDMATVNELNTLISFIPGNASDVVIQNNLPQLLPRPTYYNNTLVPGLTIFYNMTVESSPGVWHDLSPKYVLAYPQGNYFWYSGQYPFNISMADIMTELYSTGLYGIVGEASGMVLLEKGYSGPIKYYVPLENSMSGLPFSIPSTSSYEGTSVVVSDPVPGSLGWFGPYDTLSPGVYNVTYYLSTTNNSSLNTVSLAVTSGFGKNLIASITVAGNQIAEGSRVTAVSDKVVFNEYSINTEFKGYMNRWNGSLVLHGLSISQISAVPLEFKPTSLLHLMSGNGSVITQRSLIPLFSNRTAFLVSPMSTYSSAKYILGDMNSPQFYSSSDGNSMISVINNALSSGSFSVLGEYKSFILLSRNYTGNVHLLSALNENYSLSSFFHGSNSTVRSDSLFFSNSSSATVWYGPYLSLMPGTYDVTFYLATNNSSLNNTITLQATSSLGGNTLGSRPVNGTTLFSGDRITSVSFNFTVENIANQVEFRGINAKWSGTLQFSGASLDQLTA